MAREGSVLFRFLGDVRDLARKTKQAEGEISGFGKRAETVFNRSFSRITSIVGSRFGQMGSEAADALNGIAASAVSTGSMIGTGLAAGAAVAAAGLGALAVKGVQAVVDLASKVRGLQRVTGASAEDASALVAVMDDLKIEATSGAQAMFRMSKNISGNAEALRKHGIEIVRNRNGSVNLTATLLNVADAYNRVGRGAAGNKIAFDAFGRSGAALIPLLEQGRNRLERFFASADEHHELLSQEDIDAAFQYELAMDDLGDAVGGLQRELGVGLVPAATNAAETLTDLIDTADQLGAKFANIGKPFGGFARFLGGFLKDTAFKAPGAAIDLLRGHFRGAVTDLIPFGNSIRNLFGRHKDATDAAEEQADALDELSGGFDANAAAAEADAEAIKDWQEILSNLDAEDAVSKALRQVSEDLYGTDDALDSSTNKIKTYQDQVDELFDSVVEVDQAHVSAADAVEALREALNGAGSGAEDAASYMERYYKNGGSLADDHGRRVTDAAAEAAKAAEREVDAMAESGEIADTASARKEALIGKLEDLKEQFPQVATQIDRYIGRIRNISSTAPTAEDRTKKLGKAHRDAAADVDLLTEAAERLATKEKTAEAQHAALIWFLEAAKQKFPELATEIDKYVARVNTAWTALQIPSTTTGSIQQQGEAIRGRAERQADVLTGGLAMAGVTNVTMNVYGAGDDPETIATRTAAKLGWATSSGGR